MKQPKPRPLDRVLLRLLLLRMLLPSLVVTLLAVGLAGYLWGRNLGTRQLQMARSTAHTVDDYLEHASRVLGAAARMAETATPEELAPYMQATWQAYEYFDTLYRLDESGIVTVLSPPDLRYEGLDMSGQPYFHQARAQTGATISQPFTSPRTGQPAVYIAWPLTDGGLMVGELNLGELQQAIAAGLDEPGHNIIFVTDRSGTLLAHPQPNLVAQQANVGDMEIVQRGLTGEAVSLYSTDGTFVLGSAAQVKWTGWVIVAQVPLYVVYGPYVGAISIALLLASAVWLGLILYLRQQLRHHVIAPLARLGQGADALAAGDFAQGAALAAIPAAFAEIGALVTDFERMSQAIQSRQSALQASETRFREMAELLPDMIYEMDADLNLTYANREVFEAFGYTEEEFARGMRMPQTLAEGEIDRAREALAAIAQGQPVEPRTYQANRKDGSTFPCEITTAPIRDTEGNLAGFRGTMRDITERVRAEEKIRQRTAQLEALRQVGLELIAQLDLDALLHSIVSRSVELLGGTAGGIDLYQPDQDVLEWTTSIGIDPIPDKTVTRRGEGISGRVLETGEPLIVDDYQHWEGQAATWRDHPFTAIIGVPVRWGEEFLGVLEVLAYPPRTFSPADSELLSLFATQAATAIRNARLYEEAQSRSERLTVVNRIGSAVSATLHLDDLMETVYQEIAPIFQADAFFIALYDEETDELDFRLQVDEGGREPPRRSPLGTGLSSLVVTERKPLLVRDYEQEQDHLPPPAVWGTMKSPASWLGVPMLVGERLLGVISVQAYRPRAYGEKEQLLLSTIADQVAVAIENARLFQESQRRAEEMAALRQVNLATLSTLEQDQVFEIMLDQLGTVIDYDTAAIKVIAPDGREKMIAGRGPVIHDQAMWNGFDAKDNKLIQEMRETRQPVVVHDSHTDERYERVGDWQTFRSWVGAPLFVRGDLIGYLTIEKTSPGFYDQNAVHLLGDFAHAAAIALENARLYQELRSHAERLEQRVQERTAQLQAQYARLDAILHSTSDGIIVTDGQGEIIQANPVAETWLTRTLSPEDAARLRKTARELARRVKERPEAVLELTGLDLELKAAPISEPGLEEAAAVVAVHDVSHLKTLNRMKSRFTTNISHELRTPITTIKLYVHLMRRRPEKREQYLDTLAQETDHLVGLVEDILQISRIDAGRVEIKPRPTLLSELTEGAVISHQTLAQKRGVTLEHHPAQPGPVALVDPQHVAQALNVLVENSVLYTPEGGEVIVSTGEQEAEGRVWATATVADTGMGIPEEELPHIFDRFFRGDEPRSMQISGTGLGLAIVKEIVGLHGGRVTMESQVGVGTTFTIWLPLTC